MNTQTHNLWTMEDVATFCCVKSSVVKHWITTTDMPFIKIGKQIRFDPEDVKDWIALQKVRQVSSKNELSRL